MSQKIDINQGEILVKFTSPTSGKISFKDLGITKGLITTNGGFFRMVFDFEGIGEHNYFRVPTIEIEYKEEVSETHWQCDFNGETIVDKLDHHGHSTVVLLDRDKLASLEHHHQNKLVLHAEFPQEVHIITERSAVNFFN